MRIPAVKYGSFIYTARTGHVDALAKMIAAHGPTSEREIERWTRICIDSGIVRYGWLIVNEFEERTT